MSEKWSQSQLDTAVEAGRTSALSEALRVGRTDSPDEVLWRISFAILSASERFEATCRAYVALKQRWLKTGWVPDFGCVALLQEAGLIYAQSKTAYLCRLWHERPAFSPALWDVDLRYSLQKRIWGLAWAKASFATMLIRGSAQVCCIDTHMYAVLTGEPARKGIPRKEYLYREGQISTLSVRHRLPTSVVQHAIWNVKRGVQSPLLPEVSA